MLTPEEIRLQTLEFEIRPGAQGLGYEILVMKCGNHTRYASCFRWEFAGVLEVLKKEAEFFYCEQAEALEARIESDPDVAAQCCPECEDERLARSYEGKTQHEA